MTSAIFALSDKYDLLDLQKGLMEARFCDIPFDTGVSPDAAFAAIHRKLVDVVRTVGFPGDENEDRFDRWLIIDDRRREWGVALRRASSYPAWISLSPADKRELVQRLLAPFYVSDEMAEKFISSV